MSRRHILVVACSSVTAVVIFLVVYTDTVVVKWHPFLTSHTEDDVTIQACTQSTRQKILRGYCDRYRPGSSEIIKLTLKRMLVDDLHRVVYCSSAKVASSTWKGFLVQTSRNWNGSGPNETWGVHSVGRLAAHGVRSLAQYNKTARRRILDSYFTFLVVRHPLDRLVSAYNDKFLHRNIYSETVGPYIVDRYRHNKTHTKLGRYQRRRVKSSNKWPPGHLSPESTPTFSEFLRLVAAQGSSGADQHWLSFQAGCQPCHIRYDYIAKLETLIQDSRHILREMSRVSPLPPGASLRLLRRMRNVHRPTHRYDGYVALRQLPMYHNVSHTLYKNILGIYSRDMAAFGYGFDGLTNEATCLSNVHVDNETETCC